MNISAIIIARNEERDISDCLKSLKFVPEIIVIDNGSKDQTVRIAESMGAKVIIQKGLDFSYLRNLGREKAHHEWLLYIDADERVTDELSSEIKKAISIKSSYKAFYLVRRNYYLGARWPKNEKMIRLMRKDYLIGWQGSLHESPQITGKTGLLNSYLMHFTHDNLSDMVTKTNEWSDIEAQLRYKNNHPRMTTLRFIRVMVLAFYHSFIRDLGWQAGTKGLIESIYQSFSLFITYAKLWEKQK